MTTDNKDTLQPPVQPQPNIHLADLASTTTFRGFTPDYCHDHPGDVEKNIDTNLQGIAQYGDLTSPEGIGKAMNIIKGAMAATAMMPKDQLVYLAASTPLRGYTPDYCHDHPGDVEKNIDTNLQGIAQYGDLTSPAGIKEAMNIIKGAMAAAAMMPKDQLVYLAASTPFRGFTPDYCQDHPDDAERNIDTNLQGIAQFRDLTTQAGKSEAMNIIKGAFAAIAMLG
jgi:uncharacterized protein YaiE (UPF0345 family)